MKNVRTELLAPAGDLNCFYAAINAGADALYLGLNRFGARANAANFTEEELLKALDIAHMHGKKIYLTVNTLFKDNEIADLYELLIRPYRNGLDAVIVQDTGVMSYISKTFCELPIHVSTQAAVTASGGAGLLRSFNVKRIVPARELSLEEVIRLKKETGLEIECFIHGSMCYSYSGKCLLSSFIGGRSGNRGRCAQPCRLMYDLTYPLSLKDMCTIDMLPQLIDAGISSFKIEGRMKTSDYVYAVTSIYRKYIDRYIEKGETGVEKSDREKLVSGYTRSGSCSGYYTVYNGKDMITPDAPSYEKGEVTADQGNITSLPEIKVNMNCTLRENAPAVIEVYNEEYSVKTETALIPEKAVSRAVTESEIKEQLAKCGGSGFAVNNIITDADPGLFIPKSCLNEIRRSGLKSFKEKILSEYRREAVKDYIRPAKKDTLSHAKDDESDGFTPPVNVSVLNKEQLDVALSERADGVIVPLSVFVSECMNDRADMNGKHLYIALPYVVREGAFLNESRRIADLLNKCVKRYEIAGFYVSNLESLRIIRDIGYKGRLIGDIHLYAYNRMACDFLHDNGVDVTTVPLELNVHELKERDIKGEELMIYGHVPVMISANCTQKTLDRCRKCNGFATYITDRKGEKLFVYHNCAECTNVIYNSMNLSVSDESILFDLLRPSSVRFSFTDESPSIMRDILDKYFRTRKINGSTDIKLIDKYTKGHIKRGVE